MSDDLDDDFIAAVESGDIKTAEKLRSVSGLSNPKTWFSLYTLLCSMNLDDVTSDPLRKLVLSQTNEELLIKIVTAAINHDRADIIDAITKEKPNFNINATHENGDTFLHIALEVDSMSVVVNLCKKVGNINAKNKEGSTPLHFAVLYDNPYVAFHLMDAGADCDIQDSYGRTALHIATISNTTDVMEQLLAFGADIDITCNDNMTPLDYRPNSQILRSYVIARKSLNYYVGDQNLAHIDLDGNDRETFEIYKSDLEDLKSEVINDSNITYYDFLTCKMNRLAFYAQNEKLIDAVDVRSCNYPWYDRFIYQRVKLGKKRKSLFSSSLKSLDIAIFAFFDRVLPDIDLGYAIIDFLSNEDLENLIKAVPSDDDHDN